MRKGWNVEMIGPYVFVSHNGPLNRQTATLVLHFQIASQDQCEEAA